MASFHVATAHWTSMDAHVSPPVPCRSLLVSGGGRARWSFRRRISYERSSLPDSRTHSQLRCGTDAATSDRCQLTRRPDALGVNCNVILFIVNSDHTQWIDPTLLVNSSCSGRGTHARRILRLNLRQLITDYWTTSFDQGRQLRLSACNPAFLVEKWKGEWWMGWRDGWMDWWSPLSTRRTGRLPSEQPVYPQRGLPTSEPFADHQNHSPTL